MYKLFLTLFTLTVLISSCTNDQQTSANVDSIVPALLDRNEKIQNGKEWDRVQNLYANAISEIKKKESSPDAYIKLAEVFIHEARVTGEHGHYYPGALKVLDKGLSTPKIDANQKFQLLSYKASVLLSQHEFSEALKVGQQALALNNHNAQIYGVLVDGYVELGDYQSAVRMADRMINIRPDLRSYSRVSYLRQIHGDMDGAIQAMQMAVGSGYPGDEQTAWTRLTLGELFEENNDLPAAKNQYELILQERENYPFAIAALANIYQKQGDETKAEELLQKAMDIIPEVGFYEQMAVIYKNQNRTDEFNAITKEIMVMLKDDVDSGHNMNLEYAHLYIDLFDDYESALTYAKDEYSKRPENIDVNKLMAQIYQQKGKMDEAKKYAQKALRTGANYSDLISMK